MHSRFWAFALAFNARPGVMPACLQCQEEAQADTNLLLFLLWQAAAGVRLTPGEVACIEESVQSWRDAVVRPLRNVRQDIKILGGAEADGLSTTVQAAELEAERLAQMQLARHARPEADWLPLDSAAANFEAYEAATNQVLPISAVIVLLSALANSVVASAIH